MARVQYCATAHLFAGLGSLTLTAQTIAWAVRPEGTLKVGEKTLINRVESKSASSFSAWFVDAWEVGSAGRGIGWQFGRDVQLPAMRRPIERSRYLKATALSILRSYLLVDLVDSLLELFPGITPTGGSLFYAELPPVPRYALSTTLHAALGLCIVLGIEMWYDLASLVGVGLMHQSPTAWPPCHDRPWRSRSLHEFWSRRWHQVLRHTFMVYGGYPGRWLAGDIGALFGVFCASGLFHEIGFYLGGQQIDWKVVAFFVLQAVGILAEKVYTAYTGRRAGGWLGTVWAVLFVLILGQMCSESFWLKELAPR